MNYKTQKSSSVDLFVVSSEIYKGNKIDTLNLLKIKITFNEEYPQGQEQRILNMFCAF